MPRSTTWSTVNLNSQTAQCGAPVSERDAIVDKFVAQVERRRDGRVVGVLYQNGRRVQVQ